MAQHLPGGVTYYYLRDGQGSVVALVDANGNVGARYGYDPYGQTTTKTGAAADGNPFRYIGGYLDATGLYKLGERYYDAARGRFTQLDPLGGGYVYAGDNPINFIDPSGLDDCPNSECGAGSLSNGTSPGTFTLNTIWGNGFSSSTVPLESGVPGNYVLNLNFTEIDIPGYYKASISLVDTTDYLSNDFKRVYAVGGASIVGGAWAGGPKGFASGAGIAFAAFVAETFISGQSTVLLNVPELGVSIRLK